MDTDATPALRPPESTTDQERPPESMTADNQPQEDHELDYEPAGPPAPPVDGADYQLPQKFLRPVARPRTRREKERHRALVAEFRKWKQTMIDWIKRECRIETQADGSVVFLLPPRLVKVVLAVADRERLAVVENWKRELVAEREAALRHHQPPPAWPPSEPDLCPEGVPDVETQSIEGAAE